MSKIPIITVIVAGKKFSMIFAKMAAVNVVAAESHNRKLLP